eukprot:COSAG06_NODE_6741_length_2802_cov_2.576027_2_plen_371_part_00
MSEAVEGAELMLYGVSEKYKESANCRLELNYGMQEAKAMVPLMMQQGFKAKGWLGLILGQSVWYAFYETAVPTEEKFIEQMDSLIREIGDRGKIKTGKVSSEGVPPRAPAPAPVPAKAPAPAPAAAAAFEPTPEPAPAPAPTIASSVPSTPSRTIATISTTPDRASDFSPSVQPMAQQQPGALQQGALQQHVVTSSSVGGMGMGMGMGISFSEMSLLIKEQRERDDVVRAEMEAKMDQQRKEMEARLDAKDAKMMEQQQAATLMIKAELTALPPPPAPAIMDEQLAALQARIEQLHATKLLSDEELFALEDIVADYVELAVTMADRTVITKDMIHTMPPCVAAASKLVGLSAAIASDAAFARQARRKFMT